MAVKSLSRNSKLAIPELPKYVFRGKIEPPAFSRGALAVAVVLQELDVKSSEWEGRRGGGGCLSSVCFTRAAGRRFRRRSPGGARLLRRQLDLQRHAQYGCVGTLSDSVARRQQLRFRRTIACSSRLMARRTPSSRTRIRCIGTRRMGPRQSRWKRSAVVRGRFRAKTFEILRGGPVAAAKADASLQAFIASLEKAGHD